MGDRGEKAVLGCLGMAGMVRWERGSLGQNQGVLWSARVSSRHLLGSSHFSTTPLSLRKQLERREDVLKTWSPLL